MSVIYTCAVVPCTGNLQSFGRTLFRLICWDIFFLTRLENKFLIIYFSGTRELGTSFILSGSRIPIPWDPWDPRIAISGSYLPWESGISGFPDFPDSRVQSPLSSPVLRSFFSSFLVSHVNKLKSGFLNPES